jgi:hypothetical protein
VAVRNTFADGSALWGPSLVQPAILALLFVAVAPAPQTSHAPLHLELQGCGDLDQGVVRRVVSMELGTSLEEARGQGVTAHVECRAFEVEVTVVDSVAGKTTTRVLDLSGHPRDLRSRLLGLAISETLLATWIEGAIPSEPALPPAPPTLPPKAADIVARDVSPAVRRNSRGHYEIAAGPAVRWFGSGLVVKGLAADAVYWRQSYPFVGAALVLDGGYGDRFLANVGQASTTTVSVAPRLFMRTSLGPLSAMAGAGWRAGLARMSSEPESALRVGRAATVGWTGPFLALDLSMSFWGTLFVHAGLEGGRVQIPARGTVQGIRVIAFDGSWLGGEISLGMKL